MIPLLAPKPFAEFSPPEYKEYVRSLYIAPPPPPVKADFACRLNDKGNLVLTVRRTPKWLSNDEVEAIALELGWSSQRTWLAVRERKVESHVPDYRTKRK